MSLDATRWAWQQDLRPTHKLLLLAMADRAGSDNTIWPSYHQIIADTGLDRKTVGVAIQHLLELGLITDTGTKAGRTKQVPVYLLVGVEHRASKHTQKRDRLNSTENGTVTQDETVPFFPPNSPKNGTIPKMDLLPPNPAPDKASQTVAQNLNSPKNGTRNLSTTIEPKRYTRSDALSYLKKLGVPEQLSSDWLQVRKTKDLATTKTAIDGVVREAEKAGMSIAKAIQVACENAWGGFRASWMNKVKEEQKPERMPWDGAIGL